MNFTGSLYPVRKVGTKNWGWWNASKVMPMKVKKTEKRILIMKTSMWSRGKIFKKYWNLRCAAEVFPSESPEMSYKAINNSEGSPWLSNVNILHFFLSAFHEVSVYPQKELPFFIHFTAGLCSFSAMLALLTHQFPELMVIFAKAVSTISIMGLAKVSRGFLGILRSRVK